MKNEQDNIRHPSMSIPLENEKGVRPSKAHVTKVTWDAYDSAARSEEIIKAREQEIAEYKERVKELDPNYQRIQQLESVVSKQADQIKLLMEILSKKEAGNA